MAGNIRANSWDQLADAGRSRPLSHLAGASGNARNLDFLSYVGQDFGSKDISSLKFHVCRGPTVTGK